MERMLLKGLKILNLRTTEEDAKYNLIEQRIHGRNMCYILIPCIVSFVALFFSLTYKISG